MLTGKFLQLPLAICVKAKDMEEGFLTQSEFLSSY